MARYRVRGTHAVFGVSPGEVLERTLPKDVEARLLERGSIVREPEPKMQKTESEEE